ncbi:putative membrane-anchored protein [Kribbella kalugense]|uniref:Putative membrane-anchored protein n=2 Tax=Kribbella kalugense TaxID=2512221 RepID=A0A4R7ZDP2_9ACTN|nr:putative membrane-anchored protein [Kribbella kalugense]
MAVLACEPMRTRVFSAPKVPAVFLLFWVVKLLTTGIGETGSDFLGTVSIPLAAVIGVGFFSVALYLQLKSDTYHPVRYWAAVLSVAVFGTMIADGPHVALGTPYWFDSIVYFVLLCGLLIWWRRSEGTISVHSITTARRERFYWGVVLMTFGLGTAVGDATAIDFGLGFTWSILLFAVLIVVPLGLRKLGLNVTVAFWASYVLTRPLGASVADWLGKGTHDGGVGWGTGPVTAIGLLLFVALVAYLTMTHSDVDHAAVHARDSAAHEPDLVP